MQGSREAGEQGKKELKETKLEQKASQPKLTLFTPQPPPENGVLSITHQGYIYWQSPELADKSISVIQKDEDFVVYQEPVGKNEQLVVFTDNGKAYPIDIPTIPPVEQNRYQSLTNLLPKSAQTELERPVAQFFLPESQKQLDLILLTQKGRIKRLAISELGNLSSRGITLIKLKEDDRLSYICLTQEGQEMAIATTGGRVLRFEVNDEQLPVMGRSSQGNQALRLRYGEQLAGCVTLKMKEAILLFSELGYGKRLPINALRLANLGDIGTQALQFTSKLDNLAGMVFAKAESKVILLTTTERKLSLSVDSMAFWGKDGAGDRLAKLKPEEKIKLVIGS